MEDPMNAALLSQRYTGKKKKTKEICQPEPKTPRTLPPEEWLMSVEKMCPAILVEEGGWERGEERRGQSGEWIEGEFRCDVPWQAWCTCSAISSGYSGSGGSAWRSQCRERVIFVQNWIFADDLASKASKGIRRTM